MVYRVFVEKKPELANEAKALFSEITTILGIKNLEKIRVINRYDAENIAEDLFTYAINTVFSEPQQDIVYAEPALADATVFAVDSSTISGLETSRTAPASLLTALPCPLLTRTAFSSLDSVNSGCSYALDSPFSMVPMMSNSLSTPSSSVRVTRSVRHSRVWHVSPRWQALSEPI